MMIGWYYLHINGDLIFRRDLGETEADIRESDFARALWPVDPFNREHAWTILVEGLAAGAQPERVRELAEKWGCKDTDAKVFADRIGCALIKYGGSWCATRTDFINLQESPAGFGETCLEAMAELARALGYSPSKMWGNHFIDLLQTKGRLICSKPNGREVA
jgi:hypothetical protein